jgi:TatD DNase family protein
LVNLVDTHCHLDFSAFATDRDDVIQRAVQAGILQIVNPGIDLATSRSAIRLAEEYPGLVFAATGIHPNESRGWDECTLPELRNLTRQPGVVAIGEIGLDYYRNKQTAESQKDHFRQQLTLAAAMNLPALIHNRQADADLFSILEDWIDHLRSDHSPLVERPGVLHSFSGDFSIAKMAVKLNLMIGIGGTVTFTNSKELQTAVTQLPLDHLVLETDAPFLAPHPHRGRRNEPAYILMVAEKIASLKQVSLLEVARITSANATRLFSWS